MGPWRPLVGLPSSRVRGEKVWPIAKGSVKRSTGKRRVGTGAPVPPFPIDVPSHKTPGLIHEDHYPIKSEMEMEIERRERETRDPEIESRGARRPGYDPRVL